MLDAATILAAIISQGSAQELDLTDVAIVYGRCLAGISASVTDEELYKLIAIGVWAFDRGTLENARLREMLINHQVRDT